MTPKAAGRLTAAMPRFPALCGLPHQGLIVKAPHDWVPAKLRCQSTNWCNFAAHFMLWSCRPKYLCTRHKQLLRSMSIHGCPFPSFMSRN